MAKISEKENYSNILDYIFYYGIFPFSEMPFTINDSLVFSAISYLPFEMGVFHKGETVSSLCSRLLKNYYYKNELKPSQKDFFNLIIGLISSERYRDLIIEDYETKTSDEDNLQYGAIAIRFLNGIVISYRGTDNSFTGWKEDFDLCCYDKISSHDIALNFARRNIKSIRKNEQVYICGHSKGGNVAVFVSTMIEQKYQDKITDVISIDGPGLLKKIYNSIEHKRIQSRIVHIVPVDCLIGVLLNHENITHVVKSFPINDIFNQHNLFAAVTCGIELETVEDRSPLSYYVSKSCDEFLTYTISTRSEREAFFTELFQVIDVMGIKNPEYIFEHTNAFIRKFLFLNENSYDVKKKKKLVNIFREFMSCFSKNLNEYKRENKIYQKKLLEKI